MHDPNMQVVDGPPAVVDASLDDDYEFSAGDSAEIVAMNQRALRLGLLQVCLSVAKSCEHCLSACL